MGSEMRTQEEKRKRIEALLADPGRLEEILKYQSYFELAQSLAANTAGVDVEAAERYKHLNHETRDIVDNMAKLCHLPANPEHTLSSKKGWHAKDTHAFLIDNIDIIDNVLSGDLINQLRDREKRAAFCKAAADKFLVAANFLHRGVRVGDLAAAHGQLRGVEWFFILLSSIPSFIGAVYNYRAARNNPGLEYRGVIKAQAVLTMLLAVTAIIAVPIIFTAGGMVAVAAGGILLTIYGVGMSLNSLMLLGKSLRQAYKIIKNRREDPVGYREKLRYTLLEALKNAADATFFLSSSILAAIGLVALFGNPIGLPVLAGAMATIAYVTLTVLVVSAILQKKSFLSMKKMKEAYFDYQESLGHKNTILYRNLRKAISILDKRHGNENYRKEAAQHPGLFIARQAKKHNYDLSWQTSHPIAHKSYQVLFKETVDTLEKFLKSKHPVYEGVSHEQKTLHGDPLGLEVKIPVDASAGMTDTFQRYTHKDGIVNMKMSQNPTDKALCVFMDLHRGFSPLAMKPGREPIMVLKVLEAAKLAGVDLRIHPQDRAAIEKNPECNAYFEALEKVSASDFQNSIDKKIRAGQAHHLGDFLRAIPTTWTKEKPGLKSKVS